MTSADAETTALLVMDLQQGIVERVAEQQVELLDRLAAAIAAARAVGSAVIYVRLAFRPGYPEISSANRVFSALSAGGEFTDQNSSTEIHPAVAPEPGDIVVVKKRVSAFTGSDLELILRARNIRTLVLSGIATSGVVLSTLREAADRDYQLVVLTDACADADAEVHRVLTEKVFPRQADTITTAEWTAQVTEPAVDDGN